MIASIKGFVRRIFPPKQPSIKEARIGELDKKVVDLNKQIGEIQVKYKDDPGTMSDFARVVAQKKVAAQEAAELLRRDQELVPKHRIARRLIDKRHEEQGTLVGEMNAQSRK